MRACVRACVRACTCVRVSVCLSQCVRVRVDVSVCACAISYVRDRYKKLKGLLANRLTVILNELLALLYRVLLPTEVV